VVQINSRYIGSTGFIDSSGNLFLSDRTRFPFQNLADNEVYTVKGGETLRSIAARKYASLTVIPRFYAASLYFLIADFQPDDFEELQDPSIPLIPGTTLILPSERTVSDQILPGLSAAIADLGNGG
jgi:hypothetical protein